MSFAQPHLSVVIPVHNGGDDLGRCLGALAASTRQADEIIVADDGSTDGSGDLAEQYGARVLRLGGPPHGPAFARNRGAEAALGSVLVFLDADVAVHAGTLDRMERRLAECPEITALFGSYDTNPPASSLVSRYKNLMHHFVHQHGGRKASTFWAGCGAVRRDAFEVCGGFDERYTRPSIEDIELGTRLWRAGYQIRLCPSAQVTHLKRWTFSSMLRSDIADRAVPWTRLILHERYLPSDLNLNIQGRLSAVAIWLLLACLVLGFLFTWFWLGAPLAITALCAINAGLYRFFYKQGGVVLLLGGVGLHWLYLMYSSLAFGLLAVLISLTR